MTYSANFVLVNKTKFDFYLLNFVLKIINKFQIEKDFLDASFKIDGANRSLWVIPVGYVGTFLLGVGVFIFPIRGGHAKIRKNKIYEPQIKLY